MRSNFARLGIDHIDGFRAPILSLTPETAWAYECLARLNYTYSSSVLPATSPLYGWAGHTQAIEWRGPVAELPVSVTSCLGKTIPFAAGTYLRLLPTWLIRRSAAATRLRGLPVIGYLHPYDVDAEQERFMHPGINNSRIYNQIMYMNRTSVFAKLEALLADDFRVVRYRDFRATHKRAEVPGKRAIGA